MAVIGDFLGAAGTNPYIRIRSTRRRPHRRCTSPKPRFRRSSIRTRAPTSSSRSAKKASISKRASSPSPSLPGGLLTKVGKMRAAFGKVNTLHNHVLPWTDRPLVTQQPGRRRGRHRRRGHLGGPADSEPVALSSKRPARSSAAIRQDQNGIPVSRRSSRGDLSYVGHLRGYHDLTESTQPRSRRLVLARPQRPRDGNARRPWIDSSRSCTASMRRCRWKPLRRSIYHSFVGRTECIWSRREQPDGLQSGLRLLRLGRLPVRAALVRGRALRPVRPRADDASLHRHRRVARPDLLAERVQPDARRSTAAPTTRGGRRLGQRVPVSVPVFDRRARRAPVLRSRFRVQGSRGQV